MMMMMNREDKQLAGAGVGVNVARVGANGGVNAGRKLMK